MYTHMIKQRQKVFSKGSAAETHASDSEAVDATTTGATGRGTRRGQRRREI